MKSLHCFLPSSSLGLASSSRRSAATREGRREHLFLSTGLADRLLGAGCSSRSRRHVGSCSSIAKGAPQIELIKDDTWTQESGTITVDYQDGRIEELVVEIKEMFRSMSDGETNPSAYDTAWVARVPSIDDPNKPQFPATLDWILKNQQEDGSWGEPSFFLLYDRLVCTLACVLALKIWTAGEDNIAKGLKFLRTHAEQLEKETTIQRTCGFEIVFPSMLNEAKNLGLDLPYDLPCLKDIFTLREKKINRIPLEAVHSVHTTLLYSLEALQEVVQWERILKLQSRDGSFLSSPSATAVAYIKTGDKKCLEFLTYIMRRFGDHAPCQYPIDLLERIWTVDTIQRLGIDRHFREEILDTLDYVHRHAGKRGVSWGRDNPIADVDDTCMAMRLLRLHGYPISSDVLKYFKDDDGKFICFPGETHLGVSDMFNLYRLSQVSFPGEKMLKEAKAFVEPYLRNCVENNQVNDKWSLKKALNQEVDRCLRYPWKMSLQRLEAREYITHYGENDVWIAKTIYRMYNVNNPKYLELAKLEHNSLRTIYKREINSIMKWWKHCGFHDSFFTRVSPQETYFSIAATLYEPEFSASRIAYTKCNCVENVLKEVFENHKSISDLRLVCQAVEQWNPSLLRSLPLIVEAAFMGMYDTMNDLAIEASNAQEKDMFPYLHDLRLKQIQEYIRNREEREDKHFESLEEYIEHGKRDVGVAIRVLPAMLLMGEHLHDHVLKCLDNRSNIHDKLSLFLRLSFDVHSYKNTVGKETTIAVYCCMEEENCTEIEALDHLEGMIEGAFDELVHEYLKPNEVPHCCRRLMFEHARIAQFFLADDIDPKLARSERFRNAMDCLFTPI